MKRNNFKMYLFTYLLGLVMVFTIILYYGK